MQNIGDKVCKLLVAGRCIHHGTLSSPPIKVGAVVIVL